MQSGLYIVGTPIGNLSDMSPRAIEILQGVDLIAAEDTRVFGKLASHFDIKTRRISCHEHNERDVVDDLIEKIQNGMAIACVSDAGMPGISDPGFRLVRAARNAGVPVFVVPDQWRVCRRWCCLGSQPTGLRSVVFLMKKNYVMIIKSRIRLFIMKAQIVLWRQLRRWRVSCQSVKSQLCVKLQKFTRKR